MSKPSKGAAWMTEILNDEVGALMQRISKEMESLI